MAENPYEIMERNVREAVAGQVQSIVSGAMRTAMSEFDARAGDAIAGVRAEAERRIDDLISTIPAEHLFPEPQFDDELLVVDDAKADAKERAWRTGQQGIAAILVSVLLTLAGALNDPTFDMLDGGDWKVVAGTVVGAVIATATAYIQRLIKAPKSQRQ